jgi:hypothetical protein
MGWDGVEVGWDGLKWVEEMISRWVEMSWDKGWLKSEMSFDLGWDEFWVGLLRVWVGLRGALMVWDGFWGGLARI